MIKKVINKTTIYLLLFALFPAGIALSAQIRYYYPAPGDRTALDAQPAAEITIDNMSAAEQGHFSAQHHDQDNDGVADIDDNCVNTLSSLPVDMCGCPVPSCGGKYCEAGRYLRYFEVKFDFNASSITAASQTALSEAAREMIRDRNARMDLGSHTDWLGSESYNQTLAVKRSAALFDFLIRKGVPAERIKKASHGEALPVFDNRSDSGRRQNRRGEMLIGWWQNEAEIGAEKWLQFGCNNQDQNCEPINNTAEIKSLQQFGFEVALRPPYLSERDSMVVAQINQILKNHPSYQALILSSHAEPAAVEIAKRLLSGDTKPWRLHINSLGLQRATDAESESVSVNLFIERLQ